MPLYLFPVSIILDSRLNHPPSTDYLLKTLWIENIVLVHQNSIPNTLGFPPPVKFVLR